MRNPDFNNILKVLAGEKPKRPTLFEFFLNAPLIEKITGEKIDPADPLSFKRANIHAYIKAGYDYVTIGAGFTFKKGNIHREKSISLNEGALITDRNSFNAYPWQSPDEFDYSDIAKVAKELPEGMKFIGYGPGGVLENMISLAGYDNLCFMIADDPSLIQDLADAVGSRLVRHYEILGQFKSVGAMISNDDWGFKTQPMLSPEDMRKYIIPWHKKIADTIHKAGCPAILHSCGNLESLMDDIIDDIGYDAKHSYEDAIIPVEDAYDRWGSRIAILGGIDLDFVCRSTPEKIRERCLNMLKRTSQKGGYALGSGNSIPDYVPYDNYMAMVSSVL